MCCHPALTPASAIALTLARGRRTDHRRDRERIPGPEATMAQRISRAKQRIKASGVPFRCRRQTSRRTGCARSCMCCTSSSTRAMPQRRQRAAPRRAVGRGDPADQDGPRRLLPDDAGGRRSARTHAPDRRAAPRADRRRRRHRPAGRAGSGPVGRAAHRRGAGAPRSARSRSGRVGEYQLQAAIAASTTGRRRPTTPTGPRSWPCTGCSSR